MASTRYRSLSGTWVDVNHKKCDSFESDDDVLDSMLEAHPMLSQSSTPPAQYAMSYHLPRRRFRRHFTASLTAFLLLFIFYLIGSSWRSDARIRIGWNRKPGPPPVWEQFPFLKRYHGGIRTLVAREENVAEYPNAEKDQEAALRLQELANERLKKGGKHNKRESGDSPGHQDAQLMSGQRFDPWEKGNMDDFEPRVKCYLDNTTRTEVPQLLVYPGVPKGFPDPIMGSHSLLGLRDDVCFERYGRLGPYGLGYSRKYGGSGAGIEGEKQGSSEVWGDQLEVNYQKLRWADAQQQCLEANAHRFQPLHSKADRNSTSMKSSTVADKPEITGAARKANSTGPTGKKLMPRTAVLVRTLLDHEYTAEDLLNLRALVNELTIQSGGEYVVHFLIHVKDIDLQIWADPETYDRVLREALPSEFHGMGTLWSEQQMEFIYGGLERNLFRGLPVYGVYRSTYLPVQYFSHQNPEYDFVWHWELDIRYTGHFYHLFEQVSNWAKSQPRKGLWERNGRFYVPSEHGSWEDFKQMVRFQTEQGTVTNKQAMFEKLGADAASKHPLDVDSRRPMKSVWGPLRPSGDPQSGSYAPDNDPIPPTTYEADHYEWGVGEEADFITLNPLFDPHNTNWLLAEDVTGYNTSNGLPPRRTAIVTASRLSRRLLHTMHQETTFQRHTMFSEMWPGSVALHHGYKAVYAPHPVYIDRRWPPSYLAAIFNNGLHGASGGSRTSVFSDERQHNFLGTSWYYHAGFSPNLWKRWLGYRVDGDGGEQEEKAKEGRMCLPAMLLHPVKTVSLVFAHEAGEHDDAP